MTPDIERLAKEALRYEPETGRIFWKINRGPALAGSEAGCLKSCGLYRHIRIGYKLKMAHQIAWLLHFGEWAGADLDHINGDGLDNHIENLRKCTASQNQWNGTPRGRGLPKGVTSHCGKWQARITVNKKTIQLGVYGSISDAEIAYQEAANKYAGEFSYRNRAAIRAKFPAPALSNETHEAK